uniref:Endolytic peptidoglycan transglycosylase RlpA n=1 Tax=Candidatus Kentrum sp. LFY TaxID=2126342 RepID=A0A450WPE7_9GAMM|nr:MAG: rare lipoprotein A [Candidatus Kentron sp. LFY]
MMELPGNRIRRHWPFILALVMAGCGVAPERGDGPPLLPCPDDVPDAVPRVEPKSRYGNPSSYVVNGKRYYVSSTSRGYVKRGLASWYGRKFHGRRTSSGEPYDMCAMTAAHRSLPLPSYARVTNLENNRRAVVRINDRGPFYSKRIIDLSYAAATKLRLVGKGTAFVEVRVIDPSDLQRVSHPARLIEDPSVDFTSKRTAPTNDATRYPMHSQGDSHRGDSYQGDLYLQVGAFANRASAEQLKTRLHASVDGDIRIDTAQSGEHTLYKVQLGPFRDATRADEVGEELTRIGLDKLQVHFKPSYQQNPTGDSDGL